MADVARLIDDLARLPADHRRRFVDGLTDTEAALLWQAFQREDPDGAAAATETAWLRKLYNLPAATAHEEGTDGP
jgi:hypothetical protein